MIRHSEQSVSMILFQKKIMLSSNPRKTIVKTSKKRRDIKRCLLLYTKSKNKSTINRTKLRIFYSEVLSLENKGIFISEVSTEITLYFQSIVSQIKQYIEGESLVS